MHLFLNNEPSYFRDDNEVKSQNNGTISSKSSIDELLLTNQVNDLLTTNGLSPQYQHLEVNCWGSSSSRKNKAVESRMFLMQIKEPPIYTIYILKPTEHYINLIPFSPGGVY